MSWELDWPKLWNGYVEEVVWSYEVDWKADDESLSARLNNWMGFCSLLWKKAPIVELGEERDSWDWVYMCWTAL